MRLEPLDFKDRFLRSVHAHEMTIHLDDGVHRCIRFQKPDSWDMSFTITTWPGHLAISGDMGCSVFARTADMFTFFRDPGLRVNLSYWAEKLQAVDKSDGYLEYDESAFVATIKELLTEAEESAEAADFEELSGRVTYAINYPPDGGVDEACRVLDDIFSEHCGGFPLENPNSTLTKYTERYIWHCYAIVWAINKYDNHKKSNESIN